VGKSKVEVDHIAQAGKLTSYEDLPGFVERLFCSFDNFQCLCSECHSIKTLADRKGISFEDAIIEKKVIGFSKTTPATQKRTLGKLGVEEEAMSNQTKRTNLWRTYLQTKEEGDV
jgi:hypothetical protein